VNNFAVATLFSYFYRKWTWAFMLFAASIGISRMYVGVHFPVDVFGGAVVGAVCAVIIIVLWRSLVKKIPGLEIEQHQTAENVARQ
jgi:undecaprenyl-diphosphatase